MLFALMVGATSEAQATLEKLNIIIDGGTRVGETFEYTVNNGSVTVKDIDADTRTVTLTIAPATGYCIQKSDILVQKLADPANAGAPRRVPDFTDPLVVSGPVMSKAANFTFVVPDGYAGALVKVSFTELTVATAIVNPNTLAYTGVAQELVTLGAVAGAKFDEGAVLTEHTSLAGYYMKSDDNYSPCGANDEADGKTKYYKPIVTYKVEGPYDSGIVLEAGTSLDGYYTKTDDGYITCNSTTTADGTTTYYQRRESFSFDEGFTADNRLKTNAGNYVVYYKVASDNNHADGNGSVFVTIHPARLTEVTLTKSAFNYTGSVPEFELKQVKAGAIVVSSTDDYDISGNTNTAEGNYILSVTGKGNFTGTVTANYTITSASTIVIDDNTTSADVTNSAGTYILAADVSASVFSNISSGTFKGTLDGNYHTISGLSKALFNTIEDGTVKNVMLKNVSISSSDAAVGAIAGTAKGYSRIYNCGILPNSADFPKGTHPSVSTTGACAGGIVGSLEGNSRVINCFSYADVSAGTTAAGIVGNNTFASTAVVTGENYADLRTAVVNCMFYGNITGGANQHGVYGGQLITNAAATGINSYNYYRNGSTFSTESGEPTAYNCSFPADERYLTQVEFHRSLLNSNRELCGWWVGSDVAPSTLTTTQVQAIPKNASLMGKWVLDKNVAPYPILKPFGKYASIINNPGNQTGSTLKVIVQSGSNSTAADKTLYIPITNMDSENHDYGYYKVQLPYFNTVFGNPNGTTWAEKYAGNYTTQVVTGWKVTAVTTDGTVETYNTFKAAWEDGYNFADRKCTAKDIYSDNNKRVFAQGGYYYVPDGVTGITIEAYWGKAIYVRNNGAYYDRVNITTGDNMSNGSPFAPAGTRGNNVNNATIQNTTTLSGALTNANIDAKKTVYDYALVLVGNVQESVGKKNFKHATQDTRGFTIMSVDLDFDEEPDYCLEWQLGKDMARQEIAPIRFDFLPVVELGIASKLHNSTYFLSLGCYRSKGHFEVTETSFIRFGQFEFELQTRDDGPVILNGGIYEQYCRGRNNETNQHINYVILGGHVVMPSFTPGAHVNSGAKYQTRHCAVNALGGDFTSFYLTGGYNEGIEPYEDNPHCYIDGGHFGTVAAAYKEGIWGDVTWRINHALIDEFYGGGVMSKADGTTYKIVKGNIDVVIDNSTVGKYCGGPKFGDMVDGKTVKTRATNTVFTQYFGAGNGGTNYTQYKNTDNTGDPITTASGWNSTINTNYHVAKYRTTDHSYEANYDLEVINTSTGNQAGKVVNRSYYYSAQFATTNTGDVTNELKGCTIKTSFYGGGFLGGVNGSVTSTLTDCIVNGNAFGAGYSADAGTVTIHNIDKTPPVANIYTGMIKPQSGGTSNTYYWTNDYGTKDSPITAASEATNNKAYFYTEIPLSNLGAVSKDVTLKIEGTTTVGGSVYGGGEESVVDGSTTVSVTGGTIGIAGKGGADYGNVYGGGKGKNDNVKAGLVKGNTNVTISGSPTIYHNVYGGGAYGSVGDFVYDSSDNITGINKDTNDQVVSGKCTITITGGTFGWNGKENGMIFGSSRGDVGAPNSIEDKMAWVYDTDVKIGTSGPGSVFTTPTIRGSVYGGGENGHNLNNAAVHIYSGTIGIATGDDVKVYDSEYPNDESKATTYKAYNYPYRGNVYGGGCGTDKYYSGTVPPGHKANDGQGDTYNPKAGIVQGNAFVNITGGHIVHNVYGAGAMGSVGNASDATSGKTTINISGGRIGSDGSRNGNVFGAARGEYGIEQTLANVRQSEVNINYATTATGDNEDKTVQLIAGSVFGGGEAGTVKGSVAVNMIGGLILKDVYGGGALADTQTSNWDYTLNENKGGWANPTTTSTANTTFVNLLGGTIAGEAYGGGLGEAGKPAYVYGDTKVNLNGMDRSEYKDAYATILELVDGNNDGDTEDNDEDYYRVKQDVRGCAVHQVFGCNNINGTPMGESKVHVFATQNKNTENIGSRLTFTEPTTDKETYWSELATTYGMNPATIIGDATTDEAKINLLKAAVEASRYDVLAVYGGGNLSAYEPVNALSSVEATKASAHTNVIIDGCGFTSIQQVYGGGNAASTPATNVTVNGTYEIEEVFGGGNGKDKITVNNVVKDNPGANVGFRDYSAVEPTYNSKEKRQEKEFISTYTYGSGQASVNIFGGKIHRVFGGSNTKGNVRFSAVTMLEEASGCEFCVDEAYGGGKSAPMDAEAKLLMACIPGLDAAYGGAEAADIMGDVTLNITNGTFDRVFGGNNLSGTISGSIKVNIDEVGCRPIIIGELYGGGNQAPYSVFGYKKNGTKVEPRSNKNDGDAISTPATPYSNTQFFADPVVNANSFTSIGKVYGGGYGSGATMVGSPTVNINVAEGRHYQATSAEIPDNYETPNGHYPVPSHAKGKIGAINDVFGGGNAAQVIGNTNVNIGTEIGVEEWKEVSFKAGETLPSGVSTRSGTAGNYTYSAATGPALANETYYMKFTVKGVDIRGNVYGGGNNAEVTGSTNVTIGKKATTTTTPSPAPPVTPDPAPTTIPQ